MIRALESILGRLVGANMPGAFGKFSARMPAHGVQPRHANADAGAYVSSGMAGIARLEAPSNPELVSALEPALDRGEFRVLYQPQASLASGRIVAVEALLRWQSPEFGWVPPNVFIPLAEGAGLIGRIGEWVLREACMQMREWGRSGLPLIRLAVNLSPHQLFQRDFLSDFARILDEARLKPPSIEFELTEVHGTLDVEQICATLCALRAMGSSIVLDDFGTANASLGSLSRLRVDAIKIDRRFISNVRIDRDVGAIVEGVLAVAGCLGLRVIAEGVENEGDLAYLRDRGCDQVQGHLTGRPVPPSEIAHLLRAGGAVCRGRFSTHVPARV